MKPLLLPFLLVAFALSVHSENWPQFRGPEASGKSAHAAPVKWNVESGDGILWKTPIPGLAHACPIVWENQVIVATAFKPGEESSLKVGLYGDINSVDEPEAQEWRLISLDRQAGTQQWETLALKTVPKVKRHTKATHCNSTPATDGRRIVALFGSEGLFCFDMQGQLLWQKALGEMDSGFFQVPSAQWGFAGSPVIYDGKVVIQCDVQKGSFIGLFDLEDGREIWRTARNDVPTWSTPLVVATREGARIHVNGWKHSGGYDFATGREVWKLNGGGDIPVPTPIHAHGLIYLTSAHGRYRPMQAIRLNATGDITPREIGQTNEWIAWSHARKGNYMQTPIVVGDLLYGCTDSGILTCFDAHTGEIYYEERLGEAEGFTASLVAAGDHLYVTSEQGRIYVVPIGKSFSVLETNVMGETCMATPAVVDGALLFRTRGHVVAVGHEALN